TCAPAMLVAFADASAHRKSRTKYRSCYRGWRHQPQAARAWWAFVRALRHNGGPRRSSPLAVRPSSYWVRTATEVAPRVTPPASLKRRNTRLCAGSLATAPLPLTNTLKVGVSLALIVTLAVGAGIGGLMHCALALVWHTLIVTGSVAAPVSADTVSAPPIPTLVAAAAKAPLPLLPGRST